MADDDLDPAEPSLPFDTDDREFTRGFQMGLVYERFRGDDERGALLVYADCAEMLARIRERGATFTVVSEGDDWLRVEEG